MKNLCIGIYETFDDNPEMLTQCLKIAETTFNMTFEIHRYSSGADLLQNYRPDFDLLFLEISTPDIDREELLTKIRKRDSLVEIVLLANSNRFYRLGYQYDARNYLVRPVRYRHVYHELEKLFAEANIFKRPSLWISNQQGNHRLYLQKLRYIETSGRQLCLHYGNEEILIYGKLSYFEKQLPADQFFRCNHSYLVNMDYIEMIEKDYNRYRIELVTGEIVPLSRNKKEVLEGMLGLTASAEESYDCN